MSLPEPQLFDGVVLNKSGLYTATVNGYTATQMREYRNAALEEAAKVCEQTEIVTYIYGTQVHDSGAETLSNAIDAIRALKEQK